MLKVVIGALARRHWFDVSRPYEKSVQLTRGHGVTMLLTRDGKLDTHVKFSEAAYLRDEAECCAASEHAYPALAPQFLGYVCEGTIHILATRAVEHLGLSPEGLVRMSTDGPAWQGLLSYFTAMRTAQAPPLPSNVTNQDLVQVLRQYFAQSSRAAPALRYLDAELAARVRDLPNLPQHGDFVVNNLGLGAAGLVVFDWEDFGHLNLPGLDLYTLLMSVGWRLPGSPTPALMRHLAPWLDSACAVLGLDRVEFDALVPLYLLSFRYLKRKYGEVVRARMDDLLSACFASRLQA